MDSERKQFDERIVISLEKMSGKIQKKMIFFFKKTMVELNYQNFVLS